MARDTGEDSVVSKISRRQIPAAYGSLAGAALLVLYFSLLAVANSPAHAWDQFLDMWYWIILLAVGFGVQVGLYAHIRTARQTAGTTAVAASGGMSTASMVACCVHHLTDVLPLLGLSAAALFLVKYQTFFILAGVMSNLIGITIMLRAIKDYGLSGDDGMLGFIVRHDLREAQRLVVFASGVILAAELWLSWI